MCVHVPASASHFFNKKPPRSGKGTYSLPLPGTGNGGKLSIAACKSWGRSGRIHVIYHFHLFFVLLFWLSFRLHDASGSILSSLFCNQQPSSLCPLSISVLHHPSFPSSVFCLSHHLLHIMYSDSLSLCSVSIFIFSTSIHYSLPPHSNIVYLLFCPLWICKSFSTFSILPHLPYYSKPCSI